MKVRVLIFFPFLYEDELLYSVLARYHRYTGNENIKTTMNDLFGTTDVCASTILPSQLGKLCERLPVPNIYSPDDLIDQHTVLPYYAPFIPDARYQQLRIGMARSKGTSFYMSIGKAASTIKSPNYLKYCPVCMKEEKSKYGEVYWHRTHQIEGLKICSKHHVQLSDSEIHFKERKNKYEFIALEYNLDESRNAESISGCRDFGHLKYISEQTYHLLNTKIGPLGLEYLKKFYVAKLQERNLATVTGRIMWIDLIPKFNHYYGKELLKDLNCYIEKDEQDTWFHKLFRKPKVACHPLRHILVMGFLGETISSLVNQISGYSYEPFGSGPWICLNKAAGHYRQPIITSCDITRDSKTGQPVGTFSCSCGFMYSRRGPDQTTEDRFKIGRIKEFGQVWNQKLKELAGSGLSLREKARILGVDPMTVKKYFDINLGASNDKGLDSKRNANRGIWLELLNEHGWKTVTQLRSTRPEIFAWLYRNDKEWLIHHHPKANNGRNNKHIRIDWRQRDNETAAQVELIATAILNETGKPIRISKNEIGRRLGKVTFMYKNLSKLPKTREVLNKVVETVEQYQIRRIKYAAAYLKRTNPTIAEWQIIRMAGLREKYAEIHKELIRSEIYR
jgi:hypothetical protein